MDSEKIQFEKLGPGNYSSWKMQMELYLTHKDLDHTIEEDTRTPEVLAARTAATIAAEQKAQKKALALIGLRVQDEYLGVIKDAGNSARTAWVAFERMFQSVTNARKLMLRQKLASLKMEPGEMAARYIARAKDLKRDLLQADLDAKEVDLAAACGLSRDFREIRMMLEHQKEAIHLDDMLPLLIQHEARLKQEEDEDDSEKQTSMAFYGRSKQNFEKGYQKRSSGESSKGGGLKCFTMWPDRS